MIKTMDLCGYSVTDTSPFFLIAGPCVIESEEMTMRTAEALKLISEELGIFLIYKSSFDKANRSSASSYRGPGIEEGLRILEKARTTFDVPVITDVHEDTPLDEVASVVSVLQTPAFLCRQTNFIQNVARQGLPVNIKKGQFLAPWWKRQRPQGTRRSWSASEAPALGTTISCPTCEQYPC
jgi:2-dehydro-3-deoxyphosphooctonate aldolase (KDO 8-P synthase)